MAEASIAITAGSGTNLHTNTRTISATTMHDEYVLPGEIAIATYTIQAVSTSVATSNDHVLQVMAGSSLNVRVRSITIEQVVNATAVTLASFALFRLSSAGTGGTAITPAKNDTADSASGCTAMTLPSAKGTETTEIRRGTLVLRQAIAATGTQPEESLIWQPAFNSKSYIIAAGTSNGLAVKILNGTAAATVAITVELTETAYV